MHSPDIVLLIGGTGSKPRTVQVDRDVLVYDAFANRWTLRIAEPLSAWDDGTSSRVPFVSVSPRVMYDAGI